MRLTQPLMKPLSRPTAKALCVGVLLILVLGIVSCDEGADITYVNMTDKTLDVSIDGLLELTLEPRETVELLILKFSIPALFEAKYEDGAVVFSERLTWEELKAREFRLVFTEPIPYEWRTLWPQRVTASIESHSVGF